MGLAAIKIPESELVELRAAAAVQSRSISGQAAHWLRLGRAFERDPQVGFSKVELALKAAISPDDLSDEEQEQYLDKFEQTLAHPSAEEDAFFSDMQQRGGGVGLDAHDALVYQTGHVG